MIAILEDDAERIARFRAVLQQHFPTLEVHFWRNAHEWIAALDSQLQSARIISLDHDLEPESANAPDPGCGWDVAQAMAERPPICPVILHTSNSDRSRWMEGAFELGGWKVKRVVPWGDDWIEVDWCRMLRRLLRS